jgi:hypothetical protein
VPHLHHAGDLIIDVGNVFILAHPAMRLSELKAVLVVLVFFKI